MKNLLLAQFDLHQRLYNNVLDGFTDEETNRRVYEGAKMNPVKYLAGHLLNSQYGLAALADVSVEPRWDELFAVMGRSEAGDDFSYPAIDEIKAEWNEIHLPVRDGLGKLSADDLARTPPEPFGRVADSRGELWAFINHHIAYHIGQIGILRKGFGKEAMRYD